MTDDLQVLDSLPVHEPPTDLAADHSLRVEGLVEHPLDLDAPALAAFPQSRLTEDFTCTEGWLVPAQAWTGVRVGALLDAAGVRDGAGWLVFAAGAFRHSLPLDEARVALVALTLGGRPLTTDHGGPMRLVVPGAACFTSIKWLQRIDVVGGPQEDTARAIALDRLPDRGEATVA